MVVLFHPMSVFLLLGATTDSYKKKEESLKFLAFQIFERFMCGIESNLIQPPP